MLYVWKMLLLSQDEQAATKTGGRSLCKPRFLLTLLKEIVVAGKSMELLTTLEHRVDILRGTSLLVPVLSHRHLSPVQNRDEGMHPSMMVAHSLPLLVLIDVKFAALIPGAVWWIRLSNWASLRLDFWCPFGAVFQIFAPSKQFGRVPKNVVMWHLCDKYDSSCIDHCWCILENRAVISVSAPSNCNSTGTRSLYRRAVSL